VTERKLSDPFANTVSRDELDSGSLSLFHDLVGGGHPASGQSTIAGRSTASMRYGGHRPTICGICPGTGSVPRQVRRVYTRIQYTRMYTTLHEVHAC